MDDKPTRMERADALELKCALLEAQIAETTYTRLLKTYQDRVQSLSAKYGLGPADKLDFETGQITRVPAPTPLAVVPSGE